MKKNSIIVFSVFIIGLTAYLLLDTFLIERSYKVVEKNKSEITVTEKIITDNSYFDENIEIEITNTRVHNTEIYIADIKVKSLDLLKTMFANNTFGKNIKATTSDMADQAGAIFAINGDYYGSREKGYVIRDGELYRKREKSKQQDLVIYFDGTFDIIYEKDISAQDLVDSGARDVFSFGPGLVKNGEIITNDKSSKHPRTGFGQIENNHFIAVVADGRTDESKGLTLYQLAEIMKENGAVTAYNLDGGGSSTMYFNGKVMNNPVNHGSDVEERRISDMVYIGY